MTRSPGRPSGGPTEHVGVDIPADLKDKEPANAGERLDGRLTLAEREAGKIRTDRSRKPAKPKRSVNTLLLTNIVASIIVAAGLTYLALKEPRFLLVVVPVLMLGVPSIVARFKQRNGKAHLATGLVPQRGLRGIFWKTFGANLYAIFGWSWLKAPSLRDREQQALDTLWGMRHVQKILAFANSKGSSGKTPITTWLACILAWAIKQPPLALDINENPNHTADWLGIDPKSTLQLRAFLRACLTGAMETAAKLLSQCQWHRQTGTKVISAEAASLESFTPEQVIVGIKVAKMHNHSVFCDLGNGIIASGNWGAVAMADTLVLCHNVTTAFSEGDVSSTMRRYTELGHDQQVKESIIVVLGAKPEEREKYAASNNHPSEQVFVIPFNKYMAKGNPVDIFAVPRKIRVIMLEILVAIMAAPPVAKGSIDRTKVKQLKVDENQVEPETATSTDVIDDVPTSTTTAPTGATAATAPVQ